MPYLIEITSTYFEYGDNPLTNGTVIGNHYVEANYAFQVRPELLRHVDSVTERIDNHEEYRQAHCPHPTRLTEPDGDWSCDECGVQVTLPEAYDYAREEQDIKENQ